MATGWTCPSCGRENDDYRFTCSSCGMVRESVGSAAESSPLAGSAAESPPSAGASAPADSLARSADQPGEPLERTIERGLLAWFADPIELEYVTFSVAGTEHVYVQFTLSSGRLVGEAVADRFLPPEERHRVSRSVLEGLGFRLEANANWTRMWPWPADAGSVAATAAEVLRSYGIPDHAALRIATARTTDGAPGMATDPAARAAPIGAPGGTPIETPEPAAKSLLRRFGPQFAIGAIVLLVGAVGAWYFNASRSGSGEITRSGDLPASELRVGDCFDLKDPTAENVDDVAAKVCTEEHEFEVYFVGFLPAGDYPGDAAFSNYVDGECLTAFETYIGTPYLESELDVFYFTPTAEAWDEGDRSIQCAAYHPLVSRLTGSLKGSER